VGLGVRYWPQGSNWYSPASTDNFTLRDVGFSYSILLEVRGTPLAQRRMQEPASVVEGLQVLQDRRPLCLSGRELPRRLTSSAFRVQTNDSAMALSRALFRSFPSKG
jgi:hypothetical protein